MRSLFTASFTGARNIRIDYVAAVFIAVVTCVYGIDIVATYGSDLVDMCSHGKLLFLLPILFTPVDVILALKLIKIVRAKDKRRAIPIYLFALLAIAFVPSIATLASNSRELDSIEISRHNLGDAEIQKLQSLEVSKNAFPFVVRFHWRDNNIRVVFKRAEGRFQTVQDTLSSALRSGSISM